MDSDDLDEIMVSVDMDELLTRPCRDSTLEMLRELKGKFHHFSVYSMYCPVHGSSVRIDCPMESDEGHHYAYYIGESGSVLQHVSKNDLDCLQALKGSVN